MGLSPRELADCAAESMLSKKAMDVRIVDLQNLSSIVDYFVIGTADSEPQMKAIIEAVTDALKVKETRPWHVEGTSAWRWVLIDYVDVVVHIFREETRAFYSLERLWGDAKITEVFLDPENGEIQKITDPLTPEEVAHE